MHRSIRIVAQRLAENKPMTGCQMLHVPYEGAGPAGEMAA